jgi:hypothetical protein
MVSPNSPQPVGAERRLLDLGIVLPDAPHPLGAYVETVQSSSLLFLSGMLPIKDGKFQCVYTVAERLASIRRALLSNHSFPRELISRRMPKRLSVAFGRSNPALAADATAPIPNAKTSRRVR